MKIQLYKLIEGKKTYPTWTTDSIYPLKCKLTNKDEVLVYYEIDKGVHRKIERSFPRIINCDSRLIWLLGFLKGEGSKSLGKSNYRRFTVTNSNPDTIKLFFEEFEDKKLFLTKNLPDKAIHLIHFTENEKVVLTYWSKQLSLPLAKFKCFEDKTKTLPYGVCHVYLSDVLLRRVVDLINMKIMNTPKSSYF